MPLDFLVPYIYFCVQCMLLCQIPYQFDDSRTSAGRVRAQSDIQVLKNIFHTTFTTTVKYNNVKYNGRYVILNFEYIFLTQF